MWMGEKVVEVVGGDEVVTLFGEEVGKLHTVTCKTSGARLADYSGSKFLAKWKECGQWTGNC
jgi:hypothetical protein